MKKRFSVHRGGAIIFAGFLVFALVLACGGGDDAVVKVPETIINQDVPPVPARIAEEMKQYTYIRSSGFVDWLPEGKGMIIATRKGNTTQLHALTEPRGKLEPLTDYPEPVGGAQVCPDAERNYFIFSKDTGGNELYQYYRYDLATRKAVCITDKKSRHMGLTFNHAGDRVAFVNNSRTGMLFDVYVMDPLDPESVKMVFSANRPAYFLPVAWSPDDTELLIIEYLSANQVNTHMVDLKTGKVRDVTPASESPQFFAMAMVSKDGRYLYGITDRGSEFRKLVRYELESGKITSITAGIEWDVENVEISRDYSRVVFTTNEDGIARLYRLDAETWEYSLVDSIPQGRIGGVSFDPEGKRLALNLNNARMNGEAFHFESDGGKLVQWTESDAGGLDVSRFVEPKLIHYSTFDEVDGKPRMIPAFYYCPVVKSERKIPVIVNIHGGPEGQYQPRFQGVFNYIINELGIAVIAPNVRGSSGYGKSYLLLDNAEKREDSVKDIGALLDWIATRPELDANRVAVFGGSYGGYMVLASMIHFNDRLTAGVDIVGISNFVTFLKNTSAYRRDLRRAEYGDEREIGDLLNRISPTTNAHKINKPLFVIQGKQDPRVPATEAAQIVETVKKNGVPVWYQVATNEGHGFRKKDNRDYMYYSIVRFFQEYLLKD